MSLPKWLEQKQELRKQNARSRKQENDYFTKHGGKRRAGSGSSPYQPQDGKIGDFLISMKYTDKLSYCIKKNEWLKLKHDATIEQATPVLIVDIGDLRLRITEED